jgi:hypothetical protein
MFECCPLEQDHAHEILFEDGELVVGPVTSISAAVTALSVVADDLDED